jgi:hypothetical protein
MRLTVENYNKYGKRIEPNEIILNYPLIYILLKKYLKET